MVFQWLPRHTIQCMAQQCHARSLINLGNILSTAGVRCDGPPVKCLLVDTPPNYKIHYIIYIYIHIDISIINPSKTSWASSWQQIMGHHFSGAFDGKPHMVEDHSSEKIRIHSASLLIWQCNHSTNPLVYMLTSQIPLQGSLIATPHSINVSQFYKL